MNIDKEAESLMDLMAPLNTPLKQGMQSTNAPYTKGLDQKLDAIPDEYSYRIPGVEINGLSPEWTEYFTQFLDLNLAKDRRESLADISLLREEDRITLQKRLDNRKGIYMHSPNVGLFVFRDMRGALRIFAVQPDSVKAFDIAVLEPEFKSDAIAGNYYLSNSKIQQKFAVIKGESMLDREMIMSMFQEWKLNR
jgi:hypothetical protein